MKTKYSAEIHEDKIIITGAVPLCDLTDLTYFFESRLGEGCVISKHPEGKDGFIVFHSDMEDS